MLLPLKNLKVILGLCVAICVLFMYISQRMQDEKILIFKTPRWLSIYRGPEFNNSRDDKNKTVTAIVGANGALKLEKEVRVLCWIMTAPKTLYKKCKAVKETWGKRCNKVLYFSSKTDDDFPAIGLNVSEGREHLTEKTMMAFTYIYHNHFNDADWFMKADDDTYVIVENLRYFLSTKNSSLPVYYGHWFNQFLKQGYYSGGAGYVLSKEALRRFGKFSNKSCVKAGNYEDVDFGRCMDKLDVLTESSHDDQGRSRFHCFDTKTMLMRGFPSWYYQYDKYGANKNNMSDYAISFHYISPSDMYLLDYYVYHLRPYGLFKTQSG
ncbi:glycoprotein-N-acetylgalactosamine 3-beta-galactosyltransferase 1 [Patella vulgata]|uniref:glycoprotein-N-acetylgalactosamine 3-beta-galactosyltransferase 1 n=1 Tax=Patella vulgata TaxID=6465 RepID=UPI0021807D9B|nr:glycoprotein-N-acetylgalactosamine 3-beta-galactosyltransferase 1 [Patella vulgata]